jgi:tetratricopeptide (TPR) repeat protein
MALRLAGALTRFWWRHGHTIEGYQWLQKALASAEASVNANPRIRAKALFGLGLLGWASNQTGSGSVEVPLGQSVAIYRYIGDKKGIADSLNILASRFSQLGDNERARIVHEENLALRHEVGDKRGIGVTLNNLGEIARERGDYEGARVLCEESLAMFREIANAEYSNASVLHNLGQAVLHQGDYERAETLFKESLALLVKSGDKRGVADLLSGLAALASYRGQPEEAARLFRVAETVHGFTSTPRTRFDRIVFERDLAAARAQLDETAWQAAWDEGRAMTIQQAMDYALEQSRG